MENITPPRCGICQKKGIFEPVQKFGEHSLWECRECHGQFWTPMKNPGAAWYGRDERYSFRNLNPLRSPERNHRQFLKDRAAPGGKLLDIGMGTGNFLFVAEKCGYRGYGIDFDSNAIQSAKDNFGLQNVFALDLDGAQSQFGDGFFDVATMFEVLEHLDRPREFLEKVKAILKPGGFLAVSVPYRRLPDFLKPHDLPPRHLSRWDETSLRNFFELCGLRVMRVKVISITIPYLVTKFHFWFRRWTSLNLVSRASAASSLEDRRKISGRITYLARLARFKDYILFGLPAALLWMLLFLGHRNGLGLYALAKRI